MCTLIFNAGEHLKCFKPAVLSPAPAYGFTSPAVHHVLQCLHS